MAACCASDKGVECVWEVAGSVEVCVESAGRVRARGDLEGGAVECRLGLAVG